MAHVPIIKIGEVLIASVLEEIYDVDAIRLREELASTIERTGAQGVLLDISVVDTVDSFLGRMINDIAATTKLLGAQTVVVGVQPAVAITLVELGLDLSGVRTALNAETGLTLIKKLIRARDLQKHARH